MLDSLPFLSLSLPPFSLLLLLLFFFFPLSDRDPYLLVFQFYRHYHTLASRLTL